MKFKFSRTLSSNGKQTSTANQTITFSETKDGVTYNLYLGYLTFETYALQCSIKINDEDTVHVLAPDTQLTFDNIEIRKITIIDGAVEYSWMGMY